MLWMRAEVLCVTGALCLHPSPAWQDYNDEGRLGVQAASRLSIIPRRPRVSFFLGRSAQGQCVVGICIALIVGWSVWL